MEIKNKLRDLGLTDSEAEVYMALVRKGKSDVTRLTKYTGIHRTYLYDILEKLREKGLVSKVKEKKKLFFNASNPSRIKENILDKLEMAENVVGRLEEFKDKNKEETSIDVFKGKEGVRTIIEDILKEGKDYMAFGETDIFEELFPIFSHQFVKRANKKNMEEKLILEKGKEVEPPLDKSKRRYLPKENMIITSAIIYGDNVALFIWDKPYIQILIRNEGIAKSYKKQFDLLWEVAE